MEKIIAIAILLLVGMVAIPNVSEANPNVLLKTSMGDITLELYPDKAPTSVENFLKYVKSGHYDSTIFHRIIDSFMIQGGGFRKNMNKKGGTDVPIKNEATNGLSNERGTITMARTAVVNSATDQFFINVADNAFLNHKNTSNSGYGYAVFGKVIQGMDIVDNIRRVKTKSHGAYQDVPVTPIVIESAIEMGTAFAVKRKQKIIITPRSKYASPKDISPPIIEITQLNLVHDIDNSTKDYSTVIEGIAHDNSKIDWITINGIQANIDDTGNFWLKVNRGVGENKYVIKAMDTENNLSKKEIVINLEKVDTPSLSQSTLTISGKYHALIIGNNNYINLPKLKTAKDDAREVERVLREKYGFKTKLLLDATRDDILSTINYYRRKILKKSDHFLIYYAGHGEFDLLAQKAYWLPVDSQVDDDTKWLIVDTITSNIKRIASNHVLIVADSCYSGTMTRRGVSILSTNQNRYQYLKKMFQKPSRTLMASGGNEPVSDSGGGRYSVFANAFIQGLLNINEKVFTSEQLFYKHIKERVAGNADQTPEYSYIRKSGHDGGDFVFKKND